LTSALELSGRTENWSYDGIYRLTNESIANDPEKNNEAVRYLLDPVGKPGNGQRARSRQFHLQRRR
jgi:hypothetical protein